jgi:hypothetical protein
LEKLNTFETSKLLVKPPIFSRKAALTQVMDQARQLKEGSGMGLQLLEG